jgi:LPXTG-motif cell wall-anchored protein
METVPQMRKLVLAGGIAVLATLGTGTAYAGGCNQSSSSAVQQYVEQVPGACGSKATNGSSKTRKVPQALQHKIDSQGGKDAALITKIVSSEGYGAPVKTKLKVHKIKAKGQAAKTKKILSDSATRKSNPVSSNPVSASFGVITGGSDGRLLALIGLMAAVAAIAIFSALRRRRSTR